jgi:hypothetical protein
MLVNKNWRKWMSPQFRQNASKPYPNRRRRNLATGYFFAGAKRGRIYSAPTKRASGINGQSNTKPLTAVKTLLWLLGIVAMLATCRQKEPEPSTTEINTLVITDSLSTPISGISIWIIGSTGSYFGGTRKDTIFSKQDTDSNGRCFFRQNLENKWRVYVSPSGFPLFKLVKFENTVDGIVNVGQVNNITVIMKKL